MKTENGKCYIQCQNCGEIFQIDQAVPIDKIYVQVYCHKCDDSVCGLNLGDNEDDKYYFYDMTLDPRYYI